MKRNPVESSNVASIGYDSHRQTLEVEFNNGNIYQYFDVPEAIYLEFLDSDSKGRYLNTIIKGEYRYARL